MAAAWTGWTARTSQRGGGAAIAGIALGALSVAGYVAIYASDWLMHR